MVKRKSKSGKESARIFSQMKISGYSNDSNPFGDSNLAGAFIWKKKIEQDKEQGKISKKDSNSHRSRTKQEKKRLRKIQSELEKAKISREERERERRQWEEEMSRLDRQRNQEQSREWETRELTFHLLQAKQRSEIRIKESRAKPIDWLYQWVMLGYSNIRHNEQLRKYPIYNPCELIEYLPHEELQELMQDIKIILSTQSDFSKVYEMLLVLCEHAIDKTNGSHDIMKTLEHLGVVQLFVDKSSSQLEELERAARATLRGGGAIDVVYWESICKATKLFKAKAVLNETHTEILAKRKELLGENAPETKPLQLQECKKSNDGQTLTAEDILWKNEHDLGLDENEDEFGLEVDLRESHSWNEKYRPRKPRYYNRVKTGFEWNKYNQLHYDQDNPPPKIVQGYKFNIFYPDLIDARKKPTYVIEKSDDDTTVIRFHAGPPYEDIAFTIVNKEWETSRRKGYRCTFDGGVLQLWFNFKRYRYRR